MVNNGGMRLWERLERVRESQGWSGREFARRAGLAYEQHYGTLIKRLQKTDEGTRTSAETIEALSKVAIAIGFSRRWLIEGKGPERDSKGSSRPPAEMTPAPRSSMRAVPVAPQMDGGSNRERAAALLEKLGFSTEDSRARLALGAIVEGISPDSDPPVDIWLNAAHRAGWARRPG